MLCCIKYVLLKFFSVVFFILWLMWLFFRSLICFCWFLSKLLLFRKLILKVCLVWWLRCLKVLKSWLNLICRLWSWCWLRVRKMCSVCCWWRMCRNWLCCRWVCCSWLWKRCCCMVVICMKLCCWCKLNLWRLLKCNLKSRIRRFRCLLIMLWRMFWLVWKWLLLYWSWYWMLWILCMKWFRRLWSKWLKLLKWILMLLLLL